MIDMNKWLETIPGLKTEKGAMKRIDKVLKLVTENHSKYLIYRKNDGTFVPLIIASSSDWAVGHYAHHGICVTN